MNFPILKLAPIALATLLLTGCGLLNSDYAYRYRMTVEVDTPEGLKTGSAVHEQIVAKSNVNVGDISARRGIHSRGEAVAVDLPGGQTLFALIPDSELAQAVLDPAWKNDWAESAKRITSGNTPQEPLAMTPGKRMDRLAKPIGYPLLVRFGNIDDPTTVEEVDPYNLSESFGAGARLRRITLQLSHDALTDKIKERLRWLTSIGRERATLRPDPPRLLKDASPVQLIAPSDFDTELYK